MRRSLLLIALLAGAGCYADPALLAGGSQCRAGTGWFCGFDGVPGDKTHLYYCPTDATTATDAIDLGACPSAMCAHGQVSGVDACVGGVSKTKAFGYPGYGWWCGQAFSGGTAGHLYFFDNDWGADLGACANGCVIAAMGVADHCGP